MVGWENMELKDRKCIPCEDKNVAPMTREEALSYTPMVSEWNLSEDTKEISRTWMFPGFAQAMIFVNAVADIAEETGHHPDIYIWYNKVELKLSTHSIKGLSENDFIVAAKIDAL
ncbi:MAG: pterin-4-alpha-carbinolamine dehydratase [Patescibacteria group bacterium]|nr:pterin-4-alpha-carbinolamine dehydratase [Patescibacteria group bacterium]